jgi:hypothetical protein
MTDFDFNMDMKPKNATKETQETTTLNEADETVKRKQSDETNKDSEIHKKTKNEKINIRKSTADSDASEDDESNKNCLTSSIYTAKAINQQPGHTSFLTFATLLHKKYL